MPSCRSDKLRSSAAKAISCRKGEGARHSPQRSRLTRLDLPPTKEMLEPPPLMSPQSLAIAAQLARIASARWEGLARLRADRV